MRHEDVWVKKLLEKLGIGDTLKPKWSYPPRRTTQLYYEMFHTSPRLDALATLATDVASASFELFDKVSYKKDPDNTDPILDHPIYSILDNPMPQHPEMDGYTLRFLTTLYRKLIGEAFWLLETDMRGVPYEAYPVPPNWVLTTPTDGQPYYMVVPLGNTSHKPLPVLPSDVVWFKDPDITSPFGRGRARTEAIGDELESDEFAAKYGKNYFYNDATPPMIIEAPGATPSQVEQFKESWFQKVGGYLNARKPGVIPWKDSKVTKLADSVREMDFVETRRFLRDVCNQHWSIPPELQGILENSNRSTIDSAYYLWTKNVISKELKREAAILNRQFVSKFDKNITLVFENVVPDDQAFALSVASAGVAAGTVTVDEWRAKNDFAPLPEGRGDVLLRTFSVVEVPLTGPAPEPTAPAPAPAPEETTEEDALTKAARRMLMKYSEDQPRDESGRFGEGGGSGSGSDEGDDSSSGSSSVSIADAVNTYTEEGLQINGEIRTNSLSDKNKEVVKALDKAIAEAPEFRGTVYRAGDDGLTRAILDHVGIKAFNSDGSMNDKVMEKLTTDDNYLNKKIMASRTQFSDTAFTSVSTDRDSVSDFQSGNFSTVLELRSAGHSIDVNALKTNDYYDQKERVFPRDSKVSIHSGSVKMQNGSRVLVLKGMIYGG